MRGRVPPKAQTPFPFTPSQPTLARRSFTVQAVPEIATSQAPPDLQTQLERAERFGHNFANIPIFAPGTQSPLPPVIQSQLTIRQLRVQDEQEAAPSSSLPTSAHSADSHQANSERETETQPSEESKSPLADYMRRVAQAGPQEQSIQRKFLWPISAQSAENHQGSGEVDSQPSRTQAGERPLPEAIEIQTQPLAATITPLVQRQEELGNEETVQAKCEACEREEQVQRSSGGIVQAQPDLETQLNSSKGGGSPLPNKEKSSAVLDSVTWAKEKAKGAVNSVDWITEQGQEVWDWITEQGNTVLGKKWGCEDVPCNVQQIEDGANCPDRVYGSSDYVYSNFDDACEEAKRDANSKVPRGCYKRHCNCNNKCKQK